MTSTLEGTLFDLAGKVAVVTGGSKGIGRAICERLAQHGAKVVVSSRKLDVCEQVAEAIRARGGEAVAQAAHIGRKEELQALVEGTTKRWGGIDVLVCNAAVNPYYGPSSGIPDEAFDRIMSSNIKSNLWLCNLVFPGMAERGGGAGIIVSSIGGFRGSTSLGAYAISKAADMQLARNLACEWGPKGIRVNCIAPGPVETEGYLEVLHRTNPDAQRVYDSVAARVGIGRWGKVEEIAYPCVFLASDASSFMNGETIVIDGGPPPQQLDEAES